MGICCIITSLFWRSNDSLFYHLTTSCLYYNWKKCALQWPSLIAGTPIHISHRTSRSFHRLDIFHCKVDSSSDNFMCNEHFLRWKSQHTSHCNLDTWGQFHQRVYLQLFHTQILWPSTFISPTKLRPTLPDAQLEVTPNFYAVCSTLCTVRSD